MHMEANVPAQGFHQRFLNQRDAITTSLASNYLSTRPFNSRHKVELEYTNREPKEIW